MAVNVLLDNSIYLTGLQPCINQSKKNGSYHLITYVLILRAILSIDTQILLTIDFRRMTKLAFKKCSRNPLKLFQIKLSLIEQSAR